jgi:hypothetical protein
MKDSGGPVSNRPSQEVRNKELSSGIGAARSRYSVNKPWEGHFLLLYKEVTIVTSGSSGKPATTRPRGQRLV